MTLRYDFVEPPADPAKAVEFLTNKFLPVFDRFWEARGRGYYLAEKPAFTTPAQSADFIGMWLAGTLNIILAYDEKDEPAGFILLARFRSLVHARRQLILEAYWGQDGETETGLLRHLAGILKYLQAEEVVVPTYTGRDWLWADIFPEWQGVSRSQQHFLTLR